MGYKPLLLVLLAGLAYGDTGFKDMIQVTETDGSPKCMAGQLKFQPGQVSCSGNTATMNITGGGGGSSSLAVTVGVNRSSPTSDVMFNPAQFSGSISGSTITISYTGSSGGVSVYPATSTASFPYGYAASSAVFTGTDGILVKAASGGSLGVSSTTIIPGKIYINPNATGPSSAWLYMGNGPTASSYLRKYNSDYLCSDLSSVCASTPWVFGNGSGDNAYIDEAGRIGTSYSTWQKNSKLIVAGPAVIGTGYSDIGAMPANGLRVMGEAIVHSSFTVVNGTVAINGVTYKYPSALPGSTLCQQVDTSGNVTFGSCGTGSGGGIVSAGTFTWVNNYGIGVSTLVATVSNPYDAAVTGTANNATGGSMTQYGVKGIATGAANQINVALYGDANGSGANNVGLWIYRGSLKTGIGGNAGTSGNILKSNGDSLVPSWDTVDLSNSNNVTGALRAGSFPALTGDITTTAGSLATTAAARQANITTFVSSITILGSNGLGVTYNVNVGSITGAGLSSCSGASNAVTWNSSTNQFGCNTITASGGGGASTLAVGTGTTSGYTGTITSSPTAIILANQDQVSVTLQGGATAYFSLLSSSVTLQGNSVTFSGLQAQDLAIGITTGTIQTQVNSIALATGTLRTDLNATAVSTQTLATAVGLATATLRTDLTATAFSTGTLASAVGVSTAALLTQVNTKVNYSSFTATQPAFYNNSTGVISVTGVSLSTGVVGTLAATNAPAFTGAVTTTAGSLATTLAPNQSAVVTWTSSNTYTNAVRFSSNVYLSSGSAAGFDEYQNGPYAAISTVTWQNGNKQWVTLTANTTFNFIAPANSSSLILRIATGSGSFTGAWPASVVWSGGTAPTITATASKVDICAFYYSKQTAKYYGSCTQNF